MGFLYTHDNSDINDSFEFLIFQAATGIPTTGTGLIAGCCLVDLHVLIISVSLFNK
jgi:hypothetical protein